MAVIVCGQKNDNAISQNNLTKMYQLRHKIFKKKLGWNVSEIGGLEIDEYDALDPYYMISLDNKAAIGCWRMLPTTGSYMLKDTFPDLLRGEHAPQSEQIWELSRFAVNSPMKSYQGQIYLSDIAFEMLDRVIQFADAHNIPEYVTVVSVAVERLMKRNGIVMNRFGDQRITNVDGIKSVACRVPMCEQTRAAIHEFNTRLKTA